jgi:hypothetical protein
LPDLTRTVSIDAKKLGGKIVERVTHLPPHDPLGVDIDDGGQDFGYGQDSGLGGGIRLGKSCCRSGKNE